MAQAVYPDAGLRRLITASVMAAALMVALDMTIVNVALPHMQGSTSASTDEITWVLTSYIVAQAIMTPLSGWLADRYGKRIVMLCSIVGFTITSALCGISMNLGELVLFRFLQGITGAALIPMSQSILFEINPPEKHGSAMAVFGMGTIVGPIIGPVLGGWLTENFSWRWCFFINVPVGIIAFLGLAATLSKPKSHQAAKFDLFGFGAAALAIGCFQMMLDRGQQQDWFSSTEICIEAALAVFFLYALLVHINTRKNAFINPAIFRNFNFTLATCFGFLIGLGIFSVSALLPIILEQLMGYPVVLTGTTMASRGIGAMTAMVVAGWMLRYFGARPVVVVGFAITALSNWVMSGFTLDMDSRLVVLAGALSGFGSGSSFVALSTVAFGTLDPRLRNQASAIYTLIRSMGSAAGISVVQLLNYRSSAAVHSRLAEGVRPDNPVMAFRYPDFDFSTTAVARMNGQITRQAMMVGYVDVFWLLAISMAAVIPFAFLMKKPRASAPSEPVHLE